MPRTERPLDSVDSELGGFAADLRKLRDKAGKPSYRALASRAHYSAATLSDAAGGKKLPSLAVTLAYVKACDGDVREWEQRWRAIAAPPDPTGEAPYVGLKAFQKEDADRFFGREKLTAKLVELTSARPFVGVFGASGSGKSSLLRAGLLPRLTNSLIFTPGVQPLDECAVRLAQLTGHSAVVLRAELADPLALGLLVRQYYEDLVLVIDQFEEVFTVCGPEQRDWFVQALVNAPHVVIGVRADFFGHIGRHPELVEALDGAQLLVGPMSTDELRRAITEPAQHVGAAVETALVTRLVADVAGQPAALPLVQHALVETWHRRRGMTLSLVGYEEAGGVEHAIARTAEVVYDQLTEDQRHTARMIFLRLIALGEGTEDTKRRTTRDGLDAEVLEHLANARLVTVTEQHAELTHEALIRSWPRLRDWIAEDREALRVHHQLTEAAAGWDGDRDLLYKGVRLAQAGELDPASLTEPERAFLTASQADGRRRARRAKIVVSALSVLVLLLAGTVVFAMDKAREVSRQRDLAVAGVAAADARRLALLSTDTGEAIRLALAAYRVAPDNTTRDHLLSVDASARRDRFLQGVSFSPLLKTRGGRFFMDSDRMVFATNLWDLRNREVVPRLRLTGRVEAVSDDDRRVVATTEEGVVLLDTSDPAQPRKLALISSTPIHVTADSTLSRFVGVVSIRPGVPTVWTYDGSGGMRATEVPGEGQVKDMRLSPDGRTLVVQRFGPGVVELWRFDGETLRRAGENTIPGLWDDSYFSPDNRFLLLIDTATGTARVWDVADPAQPVDWAEFPVPPRTGLTVTFAQDSSQVLIGTDRSAHVRSLKNRHEPVSLAAFENFPQDVSAFDYWPAKEGFVAVTADAVWPLRTDVEKVAKALCLGGPQLSDEDWAKHFPDIERVPVC
ncbi:hypothetical protein SK803_29065 [Lentzea sp. BCCO 10_0856]|uniref:HTH cro/C1-type domain-containing protein n=1 Tax=Lentzea miocenica TaxID=3095431 RepID=A0ABU4T8L4_9PSEU|nr:hypothetical protein [Lentzea sp. BCCO 10_0856]MDX8034287.1 hypothetical protein [Lentzea sp. BCCO 10_0856]